MAAYKVSCNDVIYLRNNLKKKIRYRVNVEGVEIIFK